MEEFKIPIAPISTIKVAESNQNDQKDNPNVQSEECENSTKCEITVPELASRLCPYKIPSWSTTPPPDYNYSFEVLKCGQIIDEVKDLQKKAYWTFGRLSENDIEMAHPTVSRFHVILQYKPKKTESNETNETTDQENEEKQEGNSSKEGWYIYDLGSTHGTFLNKQRIPPNVYIRIKVGHILRLGASSRCYILQGPIQDEEPESEFTVTELKAKRQRELEEMALEKQRKIQEAEERVRNEGCDWGMCEDADAETDLSHNPYAATNNEEFFLDDPKKTLRGFFEREGLQLEYKCDEMSLGSFVCRVELPVDDSNGRPIVAEVVYKGRKKECVVQCALEACRILDRCGLLRQANQEPQKRKIKSKSDSDDDEFLDRTGDIARKRQRKANARCNVALSYEDLLQQEENLREQFEKVQSNINAYQKQQKRLKNLQKDKNDDLDSYIQNLQDEEPQKDKVEIRKLMLEEQRIKFEQQRVQRLIKLTKPIEFSIIKSTNGTLSSTSPLDVNKKQLPIIGKRNQFSKFKMLSSLKDKTVQNNKKLLASDEEELDEDKSQISNEINTEEEAKHQNEIKSNEEGKIKESTKIYGPSSLPTNSLADVEKVNTKMIQDNNISNNCITQSKVTKKHRQRVRCRSRRSEVDIDENDEHYDPIGKYAKWMPPENQCGDGFTKLNKKYGY